MGLEAGRNTLAVLEGEKPDKNCLVNPEVLEAL